MRIFITPFLLLPLFSSAVLSDIKALPLVIWHGLGDSYDSDGIQFVADLFTSLYPSTYVYAIRLDPSGSSDRTATFLGDVNDQLAQVCADLAVIPELAQGFNGLGFSQGGQFLRGYVERCNAPSLRTLVTFGSQHNGIADFIAECKPMDWVCRSAQRLLRDSRWSTWVQSRVVPAQYFRDPEELSEYLENSAFLADINNERVLKNETYKANLATLERLVMVMFAQDRTVVPKESAWWAEVNTTSGEVMPLRETRIYKEDWVGLRTLGDAGRLEFKTIEGEHMRFGDDVLKRVFEVYFGPGGKNGEWVEGDAGGAAAAAGEL